MNWDDLRIAVAVKQTGSYMAAAARLHIDETTVSRRLSRLEKDLGFKLFEAVDGARQPTRAGEEALRHAIAMSGEAAKIASLEESTGQTSTVYRLTTTDSVAVEILAPALPDFLDRHPDMTLQLQASTENVNFSRWEADFAIRLKQPEKGDFLIRKIAELQFYLFTPATDSRPKSEPLHIAYPQELDFSPESQFLMNIGLHDKARCKTKNLLIIKRMLLDGQCCGVLPGFMCAELKNDRRFLMRPLPFTREVWLLIQPHLKDEAPARALIDWVKDSFAAAAS